MGMNNIKNSEIDIESLDFNDQEKIWEILNVINKQRKSFVNKILLRTIFYLIVVYPILMYLNEFIDRELQETFYLSVVLQWCLLVILLGVACLIFRPNAKMSTFLLNFIRNDAQKLGFKVVREMKYIRYYIIFNGISIVLLLLILTVKIPISLLFVIFFYIYIVLSLFGPLIWAAKNDKYKVKLKKKYYIQLNFRGKSLEYTTKKIKTVGIYMISNHLCFKWNALGKEIINRILNLQS